MTYFTTKGPDVRNRYRPNTLATAMVSAGVLLACLALSACDDDRGSTSMQPVGESASGDHKDLQKESQIQGKTVSSVAAADPDNVQTGDVDKDTRILGDGEAQRVAQFSVVTSASAVLQPTENSVVGGEVIFQFDEEAQEMVVRGKLYGLTPGEHGFHIHAVGDCSAKDASSAGGHFNPFNAQHGGPGDARHHLGDLGNITANADGMAEFTLTAPRLGFAGPVSILQKAVVVHADADDLESDPAGNAGGRLACGVIVESSEVLSDALIEEYGNEQTDAQ